MPVRATRFHDLSSQVTGHLRTEIQSGRWREWLPSERDLADDLQVSRKTIRRALVLLEREKQIATVPSRGHRVVQARTETGIRGRASRLVTIVCPEPLEHLRPFTALWVSRLQAILHGTEIDLRWVAVPKAYSRHPSTALKRLAGSHGCACWILTHSSAAMQRWFVHAGVPCVVSGSTHPDIALPSVDVDHFALCRHAAGVFLRHGHRRVAFLTEQSDRAGELESERGFLAGIGAAAAGPTAPLILRHERTTESVLLAIQRLLRSPQRPTALFVAQPTVYLTVISVLAQHRLRIPDDLSTMCRDDDAIFRYIQPIPARYSCPPEKFARQMARIVTAIVEGRPTEPRALRITPTYLPGESLENARAT